MNHKNHFSQFSFKHLKERGDTVCGARRHAVLQRANIFLRRGRSFKFTHICSFVIIDTFLFISLGHTLDIRLFDFYYTETMCTASTVY